MSDIKNDLKLCATLFQLLTFVQEVHKTVYDINNFFHDDINDTQKKLDHLLRLCNHAMKQIEKVPGSDLLPDFLVDYKHEE